MKLLKHLVSFVVTFTAFVGGLLALLALAEEKKQTRYIHIYDNQKI